MGTQGFSRIVEQRNLGVEAVEMRIQALSEYLAVYRATHASESGRPVYGRIRELRRDIWRLRGWGWYLSSRQQQAPWIAMLQSLARCLAMMLPVQRPNKRRRTVSSATRRLGSLSLLDRAYQALEEDIQGRLLTLRLAQSRRPNGDWGVEIAELEGKAALLAQARQDEFRKGRQVAVICSLLGAVLRLRHWFGLAAPVADMTDRSQ
ncbi:MAG: hypothetical protein R3292_01945 [Alcanivorax sp.]|nr:hypothetical protein [Alcanivorax sp.]